MTGALSFFASRLIGRLRQRGILVGAAGACGGTLEIRSPLCFTKENAYIFITPCEDAARDFPGVTM
jgi:4-aminobutyrate aminotransferase-like enzyme